MRKNILLFILIFPLVLMAEVSLKNEKNYYRGYSHLVAEAVPDLSLAMLSKVLAELEKDVSYLNKKNVDKQAEALITGLAQQLKTKKLEIKSKNKSGRVSLAKNKEGQLVTFKYGEKGNIVSIKISSDNRNTRSKEKEEELVMSYKNNGKVNKARYSSTSSK